MKLDDSIKAHLEKAVNSKVLDAKINSYSFSVGCDGSCAGGCSGGCDANCVSRSK